MDIRKLGFHHDEPMIIRCIIVFIRINILLIIIGIGANGAVIYANDGKMPVILPLFYGQSGTILDEQHIIADNDSSLLFFSDWIETVRPAWGSSGFEIAATIASPGDLLMLFCFALAIISELFLALVLLLSYFTRDKRY